MSDQRVEIPGSAAKHGLSAHWQSASDPNEMVDATVVLRRPPNSPDLERRLMSGDYRPVPREKAEQVLGADPHDLDAFRKFAAENQLTIVSENPASRTVMVRGTADQVSRAFGARLGKWQADNGQQYLSYQGSLSVPSSLAGTVTAVLGLDQRPIARHHTP